MPKIHLLIYLDGQRVPRRRVGDDRVAVLRADPPLPIAGWGIGVMANAWEAYGRDVPTERQIRREMDELSETCRVGAAEVRFGGRVIRTGRRS